MKKITAGQQISATTATLVGTAAELGLAGRAIPLEARILAVADAYEAMTSNRAYRAAMSHTAARAELEHHAGTQFDAEVVRALVAVLERETLRAESTLARA